MNEQLFVVGLNFCLVSRFVSVNFVALGASVQNNISLFGVGNYLDRLHRRAALAGAVAGIYVNVERPKTERAVIARGVSKWKHLLAAMCTDKSVVVF